MAKAKTVWVCSECGNEAMKWLGKCPACNEWDTFYEEQKIEKTVSKNRFSQGNTNSEIVRLKDAKKKEYTRVSSGLEEMDRVLGGGFVDGSLTLIGGEPGIGKSTLILQLCSLIGYEGKILYISGEESLEQIKLRADRLNIKNDNIYFLAETDMAVIEEKLENERPEFCIIDSIQTMFSGEITSAPGSVSQVREITAKIMQICKKKEITTIIVGHVTKDGNIAGPRVLEHMVDTVLYLEGERYFSYRILRTVKNRFGSTNEIGMFEMKNEGLVEVQNPSSILIGDREEDILGTIVAPSVEGTRPILIEIQALTTKTFFGMPRRSSNGIDYNKLNLLIAVIEKYTKIPLSSQDVYINIVGGIKINEPAVDLAVVLAIISSYKSIAIKNEVAVIGEVGLTGEIRNVSNIEKRIKEVEKLGFKKIIIPLSNYQKLDKRIKYKIEIKPVKNIVEAINEVR
ncbi:MAG: DNA repair protein RadA [Clostridiales bacterium]|nr:DNA repair protein RadA [Clostridiales bacterium]